MEEHKKERIKTGEGAEEKVKSWLNDKDNLAFLGILILAFVVLIYYFSLTKNQPLWWDEAEYMSTAKTWAFNIPYDIDPARPPLFPFLASILFSLGLQELSIKFLIVLLPAFLAVFFTYLLIKEMFDKKTALLAALITAVSWIHIFYANRMMTDSIGLLFGLLVFYCFWKGYINNKGKVYIWLSGLFVALSFLIRLTGILYGAIIAFFLLITQHFKPLKNKNIWMILVFFLLAISPYLIWSYSHFGTPFAFRSGYTGTGNNPIGWYMINHVYDYPEMGFFILFLVGLITLIPMLLSLDKIIRGEKTYANDFFMVFLVIFILFFFIYFLRLAENRWLIAMSIGIFTITAKGIIFVYDKAKQNAGKTLAVVLLLAILVSGTYFQLKHTDMIIKAKKDSYLPVKEAGLWIKENSNKDNVVFSISYPQTVYYSERETYRYDYMNETAFDSLVQEKKPRYLIVSIFEKGHPDFLLSTTAKYQAMLKPVNAWFADEKKTQAALIIYEFIY